MTIRAIPQREDPAALSKDLERRITGRSPGIQRLRERAIALAPLDVPVLIRGGVGKEVMRWIRRQRDGV